MQLVDKNKSTLSARHVSPACGRSNPSWEFYPNCYFYHQQQSTPLHLKQCYIIPLVSQQMRYPNSLSSFSVDATYRYNVDGMYTQNIYLQRTRNVTDVRTHSPSSPSFCPTSSMSLVIPSLPPGNHPSLLNLNGPQSTLTSN